MKKGLEELKNIDFELVASKAHIVQTAFEDILNKRFDRLNPVKAKGFIKILEREFDLDLSDWSTEFDAYNSIKEPEIPTIDKLNAEAIKSDKKPISKVAASILVAAVLLGGGYLLYLQGDAEVVETNGSKGLQSEINETNASISFDVAFDQNATEQNGTIADANATEQNLTSAQSSDENKSVAPAHNLSSGSLFVEPTRKVWIGIRYLDTNTSRWFETVSEGRFDFNSSREQLIAFGHSQIKVVSKDAVTESKHGGKIRYHYKNGKLREIGEDEYNRLAGKTQSPKKEDINKTNKH